MLYSVLPGLVLGFHGCDRELGESVLAGKKRLKKSENTYDWLGHGIYFWENNPKRALSFAKELKATKRSKDSIKDPFVIGAVIDLGFCLNLLDEDALGEVKAAFQLFESSCEVLGQEIPSNKALKKGRDLLLRHLDCAVIEMLHADRSTHDLPEYDSARGLFPEGNELYPNAGFLDKNHIQICIRNPNCIKGYFRVMEPDGSFAIP